VGALISKVATIAVFDDFAIAQALGQKGMAEFLGVGPTGTKILEI